MTVSSSIPTAAALGAASANAPLDASSRIVATPAPAGFCAIDFGTSNSAVAIPLAGPGPAQMQLVALEGDHRTMPTAVFYFSEGPEHDGPPRAFGRAAVAAYVEGVDGRLMRSMKSVLGSNLIEQSTDVGAGRSSRR